MVGSEKLSLQDVSCGALLEAVDIEFTKEECL